MTLAIQSCLKGILRLRTAMMITALSSNMNFSILHRNPNYEGHIPLTRIEQGSIAVGSAIVSLFDPHRAGMEQVVLDEKC